MFDSLMNSEDWRALEGLKAMVEVVSGKKCIGFRIASFSSIGTFCKIEDRRGLRPCDLR
jgi:hypothetical protein